MFDSTKEFPLCFGVENKQCDELLKELLALNQERKRSSIRNGEYIDRALQLAKDANEVRVIVSFLMATDNRSEIEAAAVMHTAN